MSYYFSKTIIGNLQEAKDKVTAGLKEDGFGILSEINIQETLKNKLDVNFKPYMILGACNPPLAYEALQSEENIGTMLPCNVILKEVEEGKIEVAAVDPIVSMQAVENPKLENVAQQVHQKLKKVIENL